MVVSGITIEVVKKEIKNLHLAVYPPDGRVRIAAPLNTSDDTIRLFVISKLSWIRRRQGEVTEHNRQSPREYVSGENHYFKGQRYILNVHYIDEPPRISLRNKKQMDMYVRPNATVEKRKEILFDWYREELKRVISSLIEKWSDIIGVSPNHYDVKIMKTRWGTCNPNGKRLWFNLELIKKPLHCIEYIVVHEMIHLIEEKHNEKFTALLDLYLPQWLQIRDELNEFII